MSHWCGIASGVRGDPCRLSLRAEGCPVERPESVPERIDQCDHAVSDAGHLDVLMRQPQGEQPFMKRAVGRQHRVSRPKQLAQEDRAARCPLPAACCSASDQGLLSMKCCWSLPKTMA